MPNDINQYTQPGGTQIDQYESTRRVGVIPRKITYPFAAPPFYLDTIRQASRSKFRRDRYPTEIRVRHKTEILAGGHGVFAIFSKGR